MTRGGTGESAHHPSFGDQVDAAKERCHPCHVLRRGLKPGPWKIRHNGVMSNWEDRANHHAAELARLTVHAADQGPQPLPEDEAAVLGTMISVERQLLIEAMTGLADDEEAGTAAIPGVAEFDAGFLYGLAFARALDDAKVEIDRVKRGRILRLVKGRHV
jgi:hypothetical protein